MDELDRSLQEVRMVLARRFLGPQDLQELRRAMGAPQPERAYQAIRDRLGANLSRERGAPNPTAPGPSEKDATTPARLDAKVPPADDGLTPTDRRAQRHLHRHSSRALGWSVAIGLVAAIIGITLWVIFR